MMEGTTEIIETETETTMITDITTIIMASKTTDTSAAILPTTIKK